MISESKSTCPKCGGQLKYYDTVKRIVRTKYGVKNKVDIRRFRCQKCSAMHRELPDFIFPYKQYEAEIIIGVLVGAIFTGIVFRLFSVETLRVDHSDPDGPFLFLELSKQVEAMVSKKYVVLRVKAKDFIPHK